MLVVGPLKNPRSILVRVSNEDDFINVIARGNSHVNVCRVRYFTVHQILLNKRIHLGFHFGLVYQGCLKIFFMS